MAHRNLTAAGAITVSNSVSKLLITVNAALTGTITVADGVGTIATIASPGVGARFEYWDLTGTVTVNPSATCDITVNVDSGRAK